MNSIKKTHMSRNDLIDWMNHHEISIKNLACKYGKNVRTVQRWISGETDIPLSLTKWITLYNKTNKIKNNYVVCTKCGHPVKH